MKQYIKLNNNQNTKHTSPNIATDALVIRKAASSYDILLIKRGKDPYEGRLALPGGFVDYNEDPQEGCLRELEEECNVKGKFIEFVIYSI